MPGNPLHTALRSGEGSQHTYRDIPTPQQWNLDVANAEGRLQRLQAQHQGGPGGGAPNATDPRVVMQALDRYHAGVQGAGPPNNQISQAIHGSFLVDLYTVTGQYQRATRGTHLPASDRDHALFTLYRALHYAAADKFGEVFGIPGDQIDVFLRRQHIMMTTHGAGVDHKVGNRFGTVAGQQVSYLAYLNETEALAVKLTIRDGKFFILDGSGHLVPFDCSGPAYKELRQNHPKRNPARRGNENNQDATGHRRGVAGFAMGVDRSIYARRHSLNMAPKGAFYHSCYLSGREVLCTGCITVNNGVLEYINNWSGHYQPSPTQLALAIKALRAQGVDISNVTVEVQMEGLNFDVKAPVFLDGIWAKGTDFLSGLKGRFTGTAKKIRDALVSYEKRTGKWYSKPSQQSLKTLAHLKKIHDDEDLVRETRFLLGEIKDGGHGYQPASPFRTNYDLMAPRHGGELYKSLMRAIGDFIQI